MGFRFGVVALLVVLSVGFGAGCSDSGAKRTKGVITGSGNLSVHELRPGDCLKAPDERDDVVAKVKAVPCGDDHTEEVFAKIVYTGSGAYPSSTVMQRYADARCGAAYRPYVGKAYAASKLSYTYLAPSQDGWTKDKDRTIFCIVTANGDTLKSSVKGSRR